MAGSFANYKMAVKTKVAMVSHAGFLKYNTVHVCLCIK